MRGVSALLFGGGKEQFGNIYGIAVCGRGHKRMLFELSGKMLRRIEQQYIGDVGQRIIGVGKHFFRFFYAQFAEVLHYAGTCDRLENALDVRRGIIERLNDIGKRNRLEYLCIQIRYDVIYQIFLNVVGFFIVFFVAEMRAFPQQIYKEQFQRISDQLYVTCGSEGILRKVYRPGTVDGIEKRLLGFVQNRLYYRFFAFGKGKFFTGKIRGGVLSLKAASKLMIKTLDT